MSYLPKVSYNSTPSMSYSLNTVVDHVPIEILRMIASFFDTPEDAVHFGLTNRRLTHLISDGQLWDLFLQKDFPDSYANLKSNIKSPVLYKQLRNIANNIRTGAYELRMLNEFESAVTSFAVYKDKLISGLWDNTIKIVDLKTGEELEALIGHESAVACITVCKDKFISGSHDSTIKIWDPENGQVLKTLDGHQDAVSCVLVCGDMLISGSHDKTINIWDLETGEKRKSLSGHKEWLTCIAVYDGKIISGSHDNTIKIWDPETGEEQTLVGHQSAVTCITVYGDKLISGSWDNTIKIWDLKTGKELLTLKGHRDWISSIVACDHMLFSSSSDTMIKVWDLRTGEELQTLDGHQDQVICLTFFDNMLISSSEDKTVNIWDFSPVLEEGLLEESLPLADLGIVTKGDYSQKLNCLPSDLAERGISSPEDLQVLFNSPDFQYLEIIAESVIEDDPRALESRAFDKQDIVSTFLDNLLVAAKQKSDEVQQCSVRSGENGIVYEVANRWTAFLKKLNSAQAALNTLGLTRNELLEKFNPESYEKIVQGANALIDEFRTLERGTQILRLHTYIHQWGILGVWNSLRDQGVNSLSALLQQNDIAPQDIFNMHIVSL